MDFWKSKTKAKEEKSVVVASCVYQCLREQCPQWVILFNHLERNGTIEAVPEGKCALAWIPAILTEINNNVKALIPPKEIVKETKEQAVPK
jgi:hypothetical protein